MPVKFDRSLLPARPDLSFELDLWSQGIGSIAGIDEAGRGALAGPVAAAALILPAEPAIADRLKGVNDSKQMTATEREFWASRIPTLAMAWAIGFATNEEIDALGIVPAVRLAIQRALDSLVMPPEHLLVDCLDLPDCSIPQTALVKGDARSLSIAAASILAKTARDAVMVELDASYPGYNFAIHKGYGTLAHRRAIYRMGFTPIHRLTFQAKYPEQPASTG
jgi:ribonuclease HII